jgi:hypothetical protein
MYAFGVSTDNQYQYLPVWKFTVIKNIIVFAVQD